MSTALVVIPVVIVALLYLAILGLALKARRQHQRKFPAEAEQVERERDL